MLMEGVLVGLGGDAGVRSNGDGLARRGRCRRSGFRGAGIPIQLSTVLAAYVEPRGWGTPPGASRSSIPRLAPVARKGSPDR